MIRSMTAYGSARASAHSLVVVADLRSVNNRFLDISLRLPDECRPAEARLRELISAHLLRGKVELRLALEPSHGTPEPTMDPAALQVLARQLEQARRIIPDIPAPTLTELQRLLPNAEPHSLETVMSLAEQACQLALDELIKTREREGQRLAHAMLHTTEQIQDLVTQAEALQPELSAQHQARLAERLRETLLAASPEGLQAISGAELSARISQEASLFSLRADVAEELTRLQSHVQELHGLLQTSRGDARRGLGKRLDFLFQEMNREANTLGSKAAGLGITQIAIDLKLLIEQLREQAMNLE